MKKVWIFNHYAGVPSMSTSLRHYNLGKQLIQNGYDVTVFAASSIHNTNINLIQNNQDYIINNDEDVPFVYIKTRNYNGNGKKRVLNMLDFYRGLFKATKNFTKPDLIIASSVHPLTLVAGIKIAKKLSIQCVCEVRDLWPESLVAYNVLGKKNPLLKILYRGEKWIYKKANKIIFTMEGGKDYIINKGWDKSRGGPIDLNKIYHINNGVDIGTFIQNREDFVLNDPDLHNEHVFKVIYTGSIRQANNLELIIDAAKYIKDNYNYNIRFLIWGDGDNKLTLEDKCRKFDITNVIFKGKVKKEYVPYIVSKANLNILNYTQDDIWKYGGSQNKVFEYLAAGKPILCTISMGYDIITKYAAGKSLNKQDSESIGSSIIQFADMPDNDYNFMCENALLAAKDYDFQTLAKKLIQCIED